MTAVEEWRPVARFPGYEVSDLGRVRSSRRGSDRRLMTPRIDSYGYLHLSLSVGPRKVNKRIHRLVAEAFLGPCPEGQEVRHLNGTRTDARLVNLAYGTRSENVQDAIRHGTFAMRNRTHCPQGHPYDEENTYRNARGGRICRQCTREHGRRYMAKRRARAA